MFFSPSILVYDQTFVIAMTSGKIRLECGKRSQDVMIMVFALSANQYFPKDC